MPQENLVKLECSECHRINYFTRKNKKKLKVRLELKKFCKWCKKHVLHKETKQFISYGRLRRLSVHQF